MPVLRAGAARALQLNAASQDMADMYSNYGRYAIRDSSRARPPPDQDEPPARSARYDTAIFSSFSADKLFL